LTENRTTNLFGVNFHFLRLLGCTTALEIFEKLAYFFLLIDDAEKFPILQHLHVTKKQTEKCPDPKICLLVNVEKSIFEGGKYVENYL
jgi:hypothetical protein